MDTDCLTVSVLHEAPHLLYLIHVSVWPQSSWQEELGKGSFWPTLSKAPSMVAWLCMQDHGVVGTHARELHTICQTGSREQDEKWPGIIIHLLPHFWRLTSTSSGPCLKFSQPLRAVPSSGIQESFQPWAWGWHHILSPEHLQRAVRSAVEQA